MKKFWKFFAGFAGFATTGLALADDPSTSIVTTLGTYATDVGLIAVAVLGIFYGKKLVGYLKV
jgi:hypothetical protein